MQDTIHSKHTNNNNKFSISVSVHLSGHKGAYTLSPPTNSVGTGTTTDFSRDMVVPPSESNTPGLVFWETNFLTIFGDRVSDMPLLMDDCSLDSQASLDRTCVSHGPKSFKEQRMAWTRQDGHNKSWQNKDVREKNQDQSAFFMKVWGEARVLL